MTRVERLFAKYNHGEQHGYLTDDELMELIGSVETAKALANDLNARDACWLYYSNLGYSLDMIRSARRIK